MARAEHQPVEGAVYRPKRDTGHFFNVCGRTVAVVLALEESTEPLVVQFEDSDKEAVTCVPGQGKSASPRPLQVFDGSPAVCHVVDACCRAQVNEVFVVAANSFANDVSWAVEMGKRKKNASPVQVVGIDPPVLLDQTRKAANFTMFDVPFGVLELVRGLAGTLLDGYDNALVLNADNVRITADHIYELCLDAAEHPEAEVVASWISWLRRPPYLFTRAFLEGLEERGLTAPGANGRDRDVPVLQVRDHVFGEEKLAASPVPNRMSEAFLRDLTITAPEAIALAKQALAHPDEPLYAPNQPQSLMGAVAPKPISGPDKMLVDIAKDVLETRKTHPGQEELEWADAFGRRNRSSSPTVP